MLLTKKVTVNLQYREAPIVLDAVQGDSGRALEITFMAGQDPWEIPAEIQIILQYRCADGTGGIFDTLPDGSAAYVVGENSLTVFLGGNILAVAGKSELQVTILSDGTQISTFPVEIRVAPQVSANAAAGDYSNLQQWLDGLKLIGTPGKDGKDGYTPVKGVDYFTQWEKYEMMQGVLDMLPNGDEVSY